MERRIARSARIARIIAANWGLRLRYALGYGGGLTGLTHQSWTARESVQYIDRVVSDYLVYGGLDAQVLRNSKILELGPGDNLGVALRFLTLGARQVVCLDKFQYPPPEGSERQRNIYLELRASLAEEQRARYDQAVDLSHGVVFNPERLRCVYGSGAEDCDRALAGERYDLIISRAVLHEIFAIDRAFAALDRLLAADGRMVHKIDLRDYGMFTELDMHPREFLTVSDRVYTQMVKGRAQPNRRMMNYYRDKMRDLGYDGTLYICCLVERHNHPGAPEREILPHKPSLTYGVDYTDADVAMAAEIRPRLRATFQHLTDEELLTGGLMLVGVKRTAS
jgi:SAM-dependent methyltransferase